MCFLRQLLAVVLMSGLGLPAVQARGMAADSSKVAPAPAAARVAPAAVRVAPAAAPAAGATIKLSGKITDGARGLPGAVVVLTATHQMTVTNAAGEFSFDVPPHAGPLQANISYLGYTDAEVTLSTAFNASTVDLLKTRTTGPAVRRSK